MTTLMTAQTSRSSLRISTTAIPSVHEPIVRDAPLLAAPKIEKLRAGHEKNPPAAKPKHRVRAVRPAENRKNFSEPRVEIPEPQLRRPPVMPALPPPLLLELQVALKLRK